MIMLIRSYDGFRDVDNDGQDEKQTTARILPLPHASSLVMYCAAVDVLMIGEAET